MTRSPRLLLTLLLGALFVASPAQAESMSCPSLAEAVQVAACPSEEELRYTFLGFCGDGARLYGGDVLTCATFENYRAAKNYALWESADGQFSGYLSCNVEAATIHASKAQRMHAQRKGNLSRLICDYDNEHRLIHRTKAICKVEAEDCSAGECRAVCEQAH